MRQSSTLSPACSTRTSNGGLTFGPGTSAGLRPRYWDGRYADNSPVGVYRQAPRTGKAVLWGLIPGANAAAIWQNVSRGIASFVLGEALQRMGAIGRAAGQGRGGGYAADSSGQEQSKRLGGVACNQGGRALSRSDEGKRR